MEKKITDPVATLHESADAVQFAMERLMYVRSTTKQRRNLDKQWWEIMARSADLLCAQVDAVMGDDRRF